MAYFGGTKNGNSWTNGEMRAMVRRLSLVAVFLASLIILIVALSSQDNSSFISMLSRASWTGSQKVIVEPQRKSIRKAEVLVASENIAQGVRLRPNMFKVELRPIDGIEDQVIRDLGAVRNQYALSEVSVDTVVLKEQVGKGSPKNIITSRIPEGFRAVSIPVDAESGVEGWARPGAKVDVVWSTEHRGKQLVSTIVENAEVLSAERSTEMDSASQAGRPVPTHITLMVSIKDAQRIQLAKASGSLSLNLRGDTDDQSGSAETISIDRLLRPIVSGNIGEAEGKVTMGGEEYVFANGKLIKAVEYYKEEANDPMQKGSFGSQAKARMKIDDEKEIE